jgi:hypothetical protein
MKTNVFIVIIQINVCYLDYFNSANNYNNIELELNQTYCNSVQNGIQWFVYDQLWEISYNFPSRH